MAPLYNGLGEAMLYLTNPHTKTWQGEEIKGGIFDKVYLCYPYRANYDRDFLDVVELTPIGLLAWSEENCEDIIVREAKINPLLNESLKDLFLEHLDSFIESYHP